MTTALYLLRAKQLHLAIPELEQLNVGDVLDMLAEKENDKKKYPLKPTQEDFDKIFGG